MLEDIPLLLLVHGGGVFMRVSVEAAIDQQCRPDHSHLVPGIPDGRHLLRKRVQTVSGNEPRRLHIKLLKQSEQTNRSDFASVHPLYTQHKIRDRRTLEMSPGLSSPLYEPSLMSLRSRDR
jgi:hypothetical protein